MLTRTTNFGQDPFRVTLCTSMELEQAFRTDPFGMRLVRGDADQLSRCNDRYGRAITDALLDWAIQIVQEAFDAFSNFRKITGIRMSIAGDDITILIPRATANAKELDALLTAISRELKNAFFQSYAVGRVALADGRPLPFHMFHTLPPPLKKKEIIIDPFPKKGGNPILFPVLPGEPPSVARMKTQAELRMRMSKEIVISPDNHEEYVAPLTITFAHCSVSECGQTGTEEICHALSMRCQNQIKAQKESKQTGKSPKDIPYGPVSGIRLEAPDTRRDRVRFASERYLREVVVREISGDSCGTLMKFGFAYTFENTPITESENRFRGNEYGIGIKGVNTLAGPTIGDRVITRLIFSVSDASIALCAKKKIPRDRLVHAVFVDTFYLFFRNWEPDADEIRDYLEEIRNRFNSKASGLAISHITANMAKKDDSICGHQLLYRLECTEISQNAALVLSHNDSLTLRAYRPGAEANVC